MIPVVAIFDVGKTNKKLLLFDEQYRVREETTVQLPETRDEDGFPCEDLALLTAWVRESAARILADRRWDVRALNFSAYGASLVLVDVEGQPLAPLYNYLKPYPRDLLDKFYETFGDLCVVTASFLNDSLCSGLQLYRFKHKQPRAFTRVKYALHLPQYLSYALGGPPASDLTSIGCHTGLWDFEHRGYHSWVRAEGLDSKLAPLLPSATCLPAQVYGKTLHMGIGLHDSSAALIPYLRGIDAPFLQLSTGTWCISLNPFNASPLTLAQLGQDCLCYLSYKGTPVKAARLFAGQTHEQGVRRLARQFDKPDLYFDTVRCDPALFQKPPDD